MLEREPDSQRDIRLADGLEQINEYKKSLQERYGLKLISIKNPSVTTGTCLHILTEAFKIVNNEDPDLLKNSVIDILDYTDKCNIQDGGVITFSYLQQPEEVAETILQDADKIKINKEEAGDVPSNIFETRAKYGLGKLWWDESLEYSEVQEGLDKLIQAMDEIQINYPRKLGRFFRIIISNKDQSTRTALYIDYAKSAEEIYNALLSKLGVKKEASTEKVSTIEFKDFELAREDDEQFKERMEKFKEKFGLFTLGEDNNISDPDDFLEERELRKGFENLYIALTESKGQEKEQILKLLDRVSIFISKHNRIDEQAVAFYIKWSSTPEEIRKYIFENGQKLRIAMKKFYESTLPKAKEIPIIESENIELAPKDGEEKSPRTKSFEVESLDYQKRFKDLAKREEDVLKKIKRILQANGLKLSDKDFLWEQREKEVQQKQALLREIDKNEMHHDHDYKDALDIYEHLIKRYEAHAENWEKYGL